MRNLRRKSGLVELCRGCPESARSATWAAAPNPPSLAPGARMSCVCIQCQNLLVIYVGSVPDIPNIHDGVYESSGQSSAAILNGFAFLVYFVCFGKSRNTSTINTNTDYYKQIDLWGKRHVGSPPKALRQACSAVNCA